VAQHCRCKLSLNSHGRQSSTGSFQRTEPDLILYNGHFWTVDPRLPRAQAVAVQRRAVVAVGSNGDVSDPPAAGRHPAKVRRGAEENGSFPGFIDGRTLICRVGTAAYPPRSIAIFVLSLRSRRRCASVTGENSFRPVGVGVKYDDTKTSDGRRLTLQDLDAAVPDHPVLVTHRGRP